MIPVLPGPTAWLRSAFHPHQKPHVALRMCCNSMSSSDAGASQLLKPPARRRSRHHMALSGSLTLRSRSFARVSRRCWCLLVAVYVCCSTSSLVSDVARPTDTKLGYCNLKVVLSLPLLAPLKTIYFQVRSLPPASPRSRMSAVSFPFTVGKISNANKRRNPSPARPRRHIWAVDQAAQSEDRQHGADGPPRSSSWAMGEACSRISFHTTTLSSSSTNGGIDQRVRRGWPMAVRE